MLQFYSQRSVINAGTPAWNVLHSCNVLPTSRISSSHSCSSAVRSSGQWSPERPRCCWVPEHPE